MDDALFYVTALAPLLTRNRRTAHLGALHCAIMHMVGGTQPRTVEAIADAISRHRSHTSRMIQDLVNAGLVKRTEDPLDRRRILVQPTRLGRVLDEQARAVAHAVMPA